MSTSNENEHEENFEDWPVEDQHEEPTKLELEATVDDGEILSDDDGEENDNKYLEKVKKLRKKQEW